MRSLSASRVLVVFALLGIAAWRPGIARGLQCPLERAVCDNALEVETWVRTMDVASIVAESVWDNANDRAIVTASLESLIGSGSSADSVVASIGCATASGSPPDCSHAFSATLANPGSPLVLVIGFARDGARPSMTGISLVGPGADRQSALGGGLAARCGLSGLVPRTESECIATTFFALRQPTPAPPEVGGGNRSTGSSSGRGWFIAGSLLLGASALLMVAPRPRP